MVSNLSMCVDAIDGVQIGHCIQGSLSFSTQSPRRLSDFTMTMTLESRIRTTVPVSEGVPVTTLKVICSRKVAIPWPVSCPVANDFTVPFRMAVPNQFCPTIRYRKMMSLEHRLTIKVTELLRSDQGMPSSDAVCSPVVLLAASADSSRSSAEVTNFGDVELTSSSVSLPGETLFVQCRYPVRDTQPSLSAHLSTEVMVGHGDATFSKRSGRSLETVKTITRGYSTSHHVAIVELAIPADVEPCLHVPGFMRKQTMIIELGTAGRIVQMPLKLCIVGRSAASVVPRSTTVRSPVRALQFQSMGQPITSDSLALHLRQLNMNTLADKALSGQQSIRPAGTAMIPSESSGSSCASSYASTETSRRLDIGPSGPSSVHSLSPSSSISRRTIATTPATPHAARHSRNASSISIASFTQSIKSRRSSLVGRFAKRLSFDARSPTTEDDDLDFSCCGELLPSTKSSPPGHFGPGARFTFPAIIDAMPTASTSRHLTRSSFSRSSSASQLSLPKSNDRSMATRKHESRASGSARQFIDTVVEDECETVCSGTPSLAASIVETASTISSPRTPTFEGGSFWSELAQTAAESSTLKVRPSTTPVSAGALAFVEEIRPCTPIEKIFLPAALAADDFDFDYALDTVDRVSAPASPRAGADDDYAVDPFCAWAL